MVRVPLERLRVELIGEGRLCALVKAGEQGRRGVVARGEVVGYTEREKRLADVTGFERRGTFLEEKLGPFLVDAMPRRRPENIGRSDCIADSAQAGENPKCGDEIDRECGACVVGEGTPPECLNLCGVDATADSGRRPREVWADAPEPPWLVPGGAGFAVRLSGGA